MRQSNLLKQEIKRSNNLKKIRRYCKYCGHSQYVPSYVEYVICDYCSHKIYRDDKTEFKIKLKKNLDHLKVI